MKQESNLMPTKKYKIENVNGDVCELVLFDLQSIEKKEIADKETNEKLTSYLYNSYRVKMPYSPKTEEYVYKNYDKLLENAKVQEYNRMANLVREKRNKLLQESDKEMILDRLDIPKDITISNIVPVLKSFFESMNSNWTTYRQELRDITKQTGFPYDVKFPEKPQN